MTAVYPEPVHFCWLCQAECPTLITDVHYETGRILFFCTQEHRTHYQELKNL